MGSVTSYTSSPVLHCITVSVTSQDYTAVYSKVIIKSKCYVTAGLKQGWEVASKYDVTLIRMHMHSGSSPAWVTVRTGPLASHFTLSPFVLCRHRMSEDSCA